MRILLLAVMAMGLVASSGCSTAPQRSSQSTRGDYQHVKEYLSWMIREGMRKHATQGLSIAIIDNQNTVWSQGFGYMDVANRKPATADTIYPIGSISKVITATEVMRLAEAGKINIDRPLVAKLTDFSIRSRYTQSWSPAMTVRSMLAHHSGLPSDYLRGMWVTHPVSLAQLATDLKEDSLVSFPQSMYKYSNLDFSLLGRLIEVSSGQDFAPAMQRDLLNPLGMLDSTFVQNPSTFKSCSKGYRKGREAPIPGLRDTPAGGMLSNVVDMGKFIKFIFADGRGQSGQVLQAKTLAEMFRVQYPGLPLDFGHEVGLAWMLNGVDIPGARQVAWHDGGYPPFFSSLLILPEEKLGVVILANSEESKSFVAQVAAKAMQLAHEEKFGTSPPPPAKRVRAERAKLTAQTLDLYSGNYVILGQKASISRGGQELDVNVLGNKLELVPTTDGTFVPQKTLLGLITIPLSTLSVQFMSVQGRDVALLRGFSVPMVFEKIPPYAIPEAWLRRVGEYANLAPDEQLEFQRITLTVEEGVLLANIKISSRVFQLKDTDVRIVLRPISDTEAVVAGSGNGEGGTVRAISDGQKEILFYSGYRLSPTAH